MKNSTDAVDETYRRAGGAQQLVWRQLCPPDGPWPKPAELLNMNGVLAWALLRIQDAASALDVILGVADAHWRACLCRATQEAHVAAAAVPVTRHQDWWRVTAKLYACVLLAERSRTSRGCLAVGCVSAEAKP